MFSNIQYTHLSYRCGGKWLPPLRSLEGWDSWLQLQSKGDHGVPCTTSVLLPCTCTQTVTSHVTTPWQNTHIDSMPLTAWCLWPAGRPTAGACWGTSRHRISPAALCLGASTCVVFLFPRLPLTSLPSPSVSCGFHGLRHQPTRMHVR